MAESSAINGEVLPSGPEAAITNVLANGISAYHGTLDQLQEHSVAQPLQVGETKPEMLLELQDGSIFQGYSFGASRSVGGELVFQTGMVGYPESVTDPSFRGQILVMTWPLIGNYGVPLRDTRDPLLELVPAYFEAEKIHVAGLVIASYAGEDYSHHLASSSLGEWLRENDVPAIYGVDTRALTKRIRQKGSMLCRMLLERGLTGATSSPGLSDINSADKKVSTEQFEHVEWSDPNDRNLVIEVSCREPQLYSPRAESALLHPSGRPIRVMCVDLGLKFNQLRCLVSRGIEVLRVPFDYAFSKGAGRDFDGLFLSNGPGNPALLTETVQNIEILIAENRVPIFGICLGHQLLARATGASTLKMKFGNRGHNIPCTSRLSGRCYITSQNHGYAVDSMSLPTEWEELFVNANDESNEGIRHKSRPIFSVQFHPESTPGPRDTEFLFDVFVDTVNRSVQDAGTLLRPLKFPGGSTEENIALHPRVNMKKVLVIGSGGLSIGQAGEFDYSGSQAIKALKEEGIYTVLINPNIATIQTSKGLADKVYFLPINADSVRKVIKHERPDGIFVTFGGQTALQVGVELENEFESLGVTVLGTPVDTIKLTEDRELFSQRMATINAPCAPGITATSLEEALKAAESIRYPVIIRAAYALGGLGSGFAENNAQLQALCEKAFAASPQVLVERSMKGWKEIEYEVVRDARDNCITVCNMENFDPLGIHTGDSIVVAPSQTLTDKDYQTLRSTAIRVIRNLGVIGECNIQYALNPDSNEFVIIEVNARLSRSSALASKATGYPLAFVAAKLGLGIPLNEIRNSVTKVTCACFEPSLDYVVVKIPRWDLKKFAHASKTLGSAMKSVGEVMAIGRTFEEAIQKGIRGVDHHNDGFNATKALMSIDIDTELQTPSDQRLFAIANAFHQGYTIDEVFRMTRIDRWFLQRLKGLSDFGNHLSQFTLHSVSNELLRQSKMLGFSDRQLRRFFDSNELEVRRRRVDAGIMPAVKQIDTVAAEFPAFTNYLYLTYNGSEHDVDFNDHGIIVLGSGVYRIGSSVEFDWCSVTTIRTLRENGRQAITINNNPETVSTDFDEADKLYFENIALETVLDIYQLEKSSGIILSMGGQTPNNIALPLYRANVHIFGTSPESIDRAENRFKWSRLLDQIFVDQPAWKELTSFDEAAKFCEKVAYPVLIRPSYVLSGAAMNIVYSLHDLQRFLQEASDVSPQHPVVITKYIQNAKEIEMDAVAFNGKLIGHFISEHVENAGVHSGDATLIHPPQDLDPETVRRIESATRRIGEALNITGAFNIQFIAKDNEIKVIECNVRASRSFPFVSRVTGVNLIEMATKAMMGLSVTEYPPLTILEDYVGVKVPQFSFSRLSGADPVLGVEMASTGEVACFGKDKYEAYIKALIATGFKLPKGTVLLSLGSHRDKVEFLPSIRKLHQLGYRLFTTPGTHDFLESNGISSQYLDDVPSSSRPEYSLAEYMSNKKIDMYINLPSNNHSRRPANFLSAGYKSRRQAIDRGIPLVTNIKNAKFLVEALSRRFDLNILEIDSKTSYRTVILPGLINISAFVPGLLTSESPSLEQYSRNAIVAGFSMIRVLPVGLHSSIVDARTFGLAQKDSRHGVHCDWNFSVAATSDNVQQVGQIAGHVGSLYILLRHLADDLSGLTTVTKHFESWPPERIMVTDAKTKDLAPLLLLASLHGRKLHVTGVRTSEDIKLLALAKSKGQMVTLDVAVFALFFSRQQYPQCTSLPTAQDQRVLWEYMDTIDCFSIGSLPYEVAIAAKQDATMAIGIAETLPLLLTAVKDGRLTLEDIMARLHYNPKAIFNLHDQEGTSLEVEMDRPYKFGSSEAPELWTPIAGWSVTGRVKRVIFQGRMTCIDGELLPETNYGRDVSSHLPITLTTVKPEVTSPVKPRSDSLVDSRSFAVPSTQRWPSETLQVSAQLDTQSLEVLPKPLKLAPTVHTRIFELLSKSHFRNQNILSVDQVNRESLHSLFTIAQEMRLGVEKYGVLDILKGRVLCILFYEPSTRTSSSFDTAMQRLGGRTVSIATSFSSTVKGESLADTVRTLACYGDAIALRHPLPESVAIAAAASPVPILNCGNGSLEHPTQALLDLFTIREELGTVNGLTLTFIGDLRWGRTVHSCLKLLAHYNVNIQLVAPAALALPADIRQSLISRGQLLAESKELDPKLIARSDVLYCTRVQKERFENLAEYEELKDKLIIDNAVLSHAKSNMIVMHPLPRNKEIPEEVDLDQRAAYFRQMRHGLFVRMALLALVLC